MTIREPERQIEVLDEVDVLVAGAGISGCAAAVASARTGARTMLLERGGVLGGVATAGLMSNIANEYMDNDSRLVIHGIFKEVADRMAARGAASDKWAHREVPGLVIDSEQLKVVLIEMQQEAGVKVLTHTLAARPIMESDAVKGLFVESKLGRHAILARVVVDATGEVDIARQTGCPMRTEVGTASREFKMAGVDLDALYQHFKRHPETFPPSRDFVTGFESFERNWVERGIFFFPHGGGWDWNIFQDAIRKGEFEPRQGVIDELDVVGMYGLKSRDTVIINSNCFRLESLNPADVSRAELETQQVPYYVADFLRRKVPGFQDAYIVQIAASMGIRRSRGIEGEATLTGQHTSSLQPVHFDDTVGCKPAGCADYPKWQQWVYSHTCDIPYGILLPKGIRNLLVGSGKSVSCQPQVTLRLMPSCMMVGQAAGAAAGLSARSAVTPRDVDIPTLQRALLEQGVNLGSKQRLRNLFGAAESS